MSIHVPVPRRLATAISWPLATVWTAWHYMWRILPVHRHEEDGSLDEDLPPPLPDDVSHEQIQQPRDGFGPLLHRVYSCRIVEAELGARELIAAVSADPDQLAPWQLARFRKTRGEEGRMARGDEFLVHMPGPWDGPVRVVALGEDRFRFATLDGHLEAGQIEWAASDGETLEFRVESWSRGGDRVSAFIHDRLPMAKEVQLYMWTSLVQRVPEVSGGRLLNGVAVHTRRVPPQEFDGDGA